MEGGAGELAYSHAEPSGPAASARPDDPMRLSSMVPAGESRPSPRPVGPLCTNHTEPLDVGATRSTAWAATRYSCIAPEGETRTIAAGPSPATQRLPAWSDAMCLAIVELGNAKLVTSPVGRRRCTLPPPVIQRFPSPPSAISYGWTEFEKGTARMQPSEVTRTMLKLDEASFFTGAVTHIAPSGPATASQVAKEPVGSTENSLAVPTTVCADSGEAAQIEPKKRVVMISAARCLG